MRNRYKDFATTETIFVIFFALKGDYFDNKS